MFHNVIAAGEVLNPELPEELRLMAIDDEDEEEDTDVDDEDLEDDEDLDDEDLDDEDSDEDDLAEGGDRIDGEEVREIHGQRSRWRMPICWSTMPS